MLNFIVHKHIGSAGWWGDGGGGRGVASSRTCKEMIGIICYIKEKLLN